MIGKTLHSQDFKSLCRYVSREGSVLLGSNTLGMTPGEIASEFQMLHALRPGISKPVVHLIGAFAPGENPTDEEMFEAAMRLMREQGYKGTLWSVWRHFDGTTHHFHIVMTI